jgi:hypothetical protein
MFSTVGIGCGTGSSNRARAAVIIGSLLDGVALFDARPSADESVSDIASCSSVGDASSFPAATMHRHDPYAPTYHVDIGLGVARAASVTCLATQRRRRTSALVWLRAKIDIYRQTIVIVVYHICHRCLLSDERQQTVHEICI